MENITKLANHSVNILKETYNELVDFEESFDSNIDNLVQADPVTLITNLHNISNIIDNIVGKLELSVKISTAIRDISATNNNGIKFENYLGYIISDKDTEHNDSNIENENDNSSILGDVFSKYIDIISGLVENIAQSDDNTNDILKKYISNFTKTDNKSNDEDDISSDGNDIIHSMNNVMKPVGDDDVIPSIDPDRCKIDSEDDNERFMASLRDMANFIIDEINMYRIEGVFKVSKENLDKVTKAFDNIKIKYEDNIKE